mmetsp:Transcript_25985/g.72484  ORF Transcript_25985/g.72484 Transcript_25985/m.72484 type:complete len:760 (-) Transcript_25985:158-2437(-)|eukprot:CAMPEP_0119561260 /NCGR_PEP_ID=MMETSP1352-20130426/17122_1 /TAXON_ID=265584 /ORGANISM="Stauroneis constricta, Strain CCMP1120" /LENGTH=759 /DNA_ID=CAMNT_0007609427 /DNA_START=217 /DNA_END=2496 /DNA_ORIENTATION=+
MKLIHSLALLVLSSAASPTVLVAASSTTGGGGAVCSSAADCLDETEYCGNGHCQRIGNCAIDSDCLNPSNTFTEILCVGHSYCDDKGVCFKDCGTMCPADAPEAVNCLVSPCSIVAAAAAQEGGAIDPEANSVASCVDSYCGGCIAIQFDAAGFATTQPTSSSSSTSSSSPPEQTACSRDADCNTSTQYCARGFCMDHAQCENRADCLNPSNKYDVIECVGPIDCYSGQCGRQCAPSMCPEGLDQVSCYVPPCPVSICETGTRCVDDYCGGCNAIFFDDAGNQVCPPPSQVDNDKTEELANDGGDGTTCDSNNDCSESQYCGGGTCLDMGKCNVDLDCFNPTNEFASVDCLGVMACDPNGECGVECGGDSMCPEGMPRSDFCYTEPCSVVDACAEAVSCVNDYCGGCFTIQFDAAGHRVCNEDPQVAFDAAKELWTAAALTAYDFGYRRTCFCDPKSVAPFLVRVEDGAITKILNQDWTNVDDPDVRAVVQSIDQLFDTIQQAIDGNAHSLKVTYNEQFGYPETVSIDYNFNIADDEVVYEIRFLTPISQISNDLAAAMDKWESVELETYSYQYTQFCECPQDGLPIIITVTDGAVTSIQIDPTVEISSIGNGNFDDVTSLINQQDISTYPTIDKLFQDISIAVHNVMVVTIDVEFDDVYGYPNDIFINYDELIADQELIATAKLLSSPVPPPLEDSSDGIKEGTGGGGGTNSEEDGNNNSEEDGSGAASRNEVMRFFALYTMLMVGTGAAVNAAAYDG